MSTETCQEWIYSSGSFRGHVCGRKLSGSEDYPKLCGLHASAKRRRKVKNQRSDIRRAEVAAELDAFKDRMIAVSNSLGLKMSAETEWPNTGPDAYTGAHSTGNVRVSLTELETLMAEVEQLRNGGAK